MSTDICRQLAAPFDPKTVSWRVGPTSQDKSKGMALAYIDARDVMRRLDDVCGPENWQDEYPWSDGKRVVCRIGVRVGDEWIWKTDGAGDTDTEGEKGALSDAFKRAAVKWGIGRYLYDTESPWVQIEKKGNSYVIPKAELDKLAGLLRRQFGGTPPPAGERYAAPPPQPHANGKPAPAPLAAALPPNPEEPPEVREARDLARVDFDRLRREFSEALTVEAIEHEKRGIWARNQEALARIQKHGGLEAIAKLHFHASQRLDQLRGLFTDEAAQ